MPFIRPISGRQNIKLRKGSEKIKALTSKEKLFCTYYCLSRNGKEAAVKSGYVFPEKSAAKLLKKKVVIDEIERNDKARRTSQNDIISGYYRLAFGCFADAVGLLFAEDMSEEKLQQLDLFNISDIKRKKGGDIEIKFFDRLKALERLQEITLHQDNQGALSLFSAIEKGAEALRDDEDE